MKYFFIIVCLAAGAIQCAGQSRAGITGKRDSSYTIASEYSKHAKAYPNLKIAERKQAGTIYSDLDIVYARTPERNLKLDVYLPVDAPPQMKRTTLIFLHGGGWRSGDHKMHYPLLEALAEKGYICIAPEYRLSTEALFPAAVYDVKTAIRWARKYATTYHIDTNKIVLAGHSSGGELAAFAGATNGNPLYEGKGEYTNFSSDANAVIDIDGTLAFIHPESGEGDDSKKTSAATWWFGYSKTENPTLWKEAAPLTHAGANTPPVCFLNSGVARMHAGRENFRAILNQYFIYQEVITFENAPHSFLFFHPWFDSTVQVMDGFLRKIFLAPNTKGTKRIIVAQDGSGDFTRIQDAFNSIPYRNQQPVVIFIKAGVYREKLFLDSTKDHVCLMGADKYNTILTWDDHTGKLSPNGDTINTRTSWSVKIKAAQFRAYNITFRNEAGFTAGQAVAVESSGDRALFSNCRFTGHQDVLFLNNEQSRQYFQDCYIEGTTDFIFGSSTAWFDHCDIYSKKNSHVTAASTPATNKWGFVFNECTLRGDTSLHNVSLGRPWRPYAAVTYLQCNIGAHIKPEGWSNWNNTDNYKTTRYAEYKSYGPSADPSKRVVWSKQLTETEAKEYNREFYLANWNSNKK
ncbi:MAG: pectinesterase family protein [Bacteroidetes bacterium]|nr:pectinesterase family protein [Bacteroidota bacterium]